MALPRRSWSATTAQDRSPGPPLDFAAALAARQGRYLAARATGLTIKEAAEEAGISYATARRYDDLPAVQRLLAELQAEAVRQAERVLLAGAERAARRLVELVEPQPYSRVLWVNLKAALAILNYVLGKPEHVCR